MIISKDVSNEISGEDLMLSEFVHAKSDLNDDNDSTASYVETEEVLITLSQADQAFLEQEFELAGSLYHKLILIKPDQSHAYCRLGEIALKQQNYDLAINFYNQAIQFQPNYPWSYSGLGLCFMRQMQWDKAIINYQQALTLSPDNEYINFQLLEAQRNKKTQEDTQILLNIADQAFSSKDLDLAKKYYLELIEYDLKRTHVLCRLGEIALLQGFIDLAEVFYQQAIENNPNYAWSYVGLGECFLQKKQWKKAIELLKFAQQIKPESEYINELLRKNIGDLDEKINLSNERLIEADILFSQGDLKGSQSVYQEINDVLPDLIHPICRLGEISIKVKDYDSALNYYTKAVNIDSNYVWAQFGLGVTLLEKREWDKARPVLTLALALQPNNISIASKLKKCQVEQCLHEAQTCLEANNIDGAHMFITKGLLVDPESIEVYEVFHRIFGASQDSSPNALSRYKSELESHKVYLNGLKLIITNWAV